MPDVTNPHDKFFRETWSDREIARDFLANFLPSEVVQYLDLATLDITKDSFVDRDLQEYFSDILYTVKIAGEPGYIYVLFEHKSYPERWIHLQLLEYMLKIWRLFLKQHTGRKRPSLPVILPMVLYHHPDKWTVPTALHGMFRQVPDVFRDYLPDFRYLLYDLSRYSDADIRGAVVSRVGVLLLKHIFDPELAPRVFEILTLMRDVIGSPAVCGPYLCSCDTF